MKKNKIKILILLFCPFLVILVMVALQDSLRRLAGFFPPCAFNQITGKLCPACGNTRSVLALLRGDFLTSLQYNITPVVVCVLVLLLYMEKLLKDFGKNVRILPRKTVFWVVFLLGMFLYFVFRNFA